MIEPTVDSVRTALHLLGVAIWVGGQIVLAAIVPRLRAVAPQAMKTIAQAFARVAWPAMLLVVLTGVWSFADVNAADRETAYSVTFGIKMLLVGATAAATLIHSLGTSKAAKAIGGAVGLLSALAAAYLGVLLAHAG